MDGRTPGSTLWKRYGSGLMDQSLGRIHDARLHDELEATRKDERPPQWRCALKSAGAHAHCCILDQGFSSDIVSARTFASVCDAGGIVRFNDSAGKAVGWRGRTPLAPAASSSSSQGRYDAHVSPMAQVKTSPVSASQLISSMCRNFATSCMML